MPGARLVLGLDMIQLLARYRVRTTKNPGYSSNSAQ
uniref:Uncharacterized protein n=1 Tax=Talaromyces marneffei PM1 TaxID=1077442 RepID=A0A093V9Z6_TALMA